MSTEDLNDLKYDMFQIKKRLHERSSENQLLKVQVRKLQTELNKKNKQFDALLDTRKSSCIRKIITERGAGIIVNLKQRNTELEQEMGVKNACIKKLQSELEMSNLYLPKDVLHNKHNIMKLQDCYASSNSKCSTFRTRPSSSRINTPSNLICKTPSEIRIDCTQLENNLRKIKLAYENSCSLPNKNLINESSQTDFTSKLLIEKDTNIKSSILLNNIEPCKAQGMGYLLLKINGLQDSISKLYSENGTTRLLIKQKDKNIEYLSNQIKHLRRCNFKKNKRSSSSLMKPSNNKKEKNSVKLIYSQDSFEEDITEQQTIVSNDSSKASSPIEESLSVESDDDDVETGDSK